MFLECDCALLGVPNYAVDELTADRIFLRVQHFSSVAMPEHPVTLRMPGHVDDVLWSNNVGPTFDQISQFIEEMNLGHVYAAHDLLRLYNQILGSAVRHEFTVPAIEAIENFQIEPDLPDGLTPTALRDASIRTILECGCLRAQGEDSIVASAFVGDDAIEFKFSVNIETEDDEGVVTGTALTAPSLASLVGRGEEVWRSSTSESSMILSVALGAAERASGGGTRSFGFSNDFFASLAALEAVGEGSNSRNVYAIISALIADNCGNDRHEYGVAEPLVRAEDGAVAWRLHVTKRHGALRLMYWLRDNYIEFANLELKANLRICGEAELARSVYSVEGILRP